MLFAYSRDHSGLKRMAADVAPKEAIWIDLLRPSVEEVAEIGALGLMVPSLAEMEEIEISNRLYREEGADYMTVVLPGLSETQTPITGPVTFILTHTRLVTVRHHAPRPFETYPDRADKATAGAATPERVFLGLVEDIVARLADLLEGSGRSLDDVMRAAFGGTAAQDPNLLQTALETTGRQGELLSRVRLSLLTLERALSFFGQTLAARTEGDALAVLVKAQTEDMKALEVHADFLSSRVSLAVDATLGMINLSQNVTVRIVSVVAALFLPPTLIASMYGMNFTGMPELQWHYGYPYALGLMLASAVGTYFFFKWKRWL